MDARKRLISVAANLIHTKGFNNTSIQDILDESSVCRSNFYYHFDSKEQLGFEVLGRQVLHCVWPAELLVMYPSPAEHPVPMLRLVR